MTSRLYPAFLALLAGCSGDHAPVESMEPAAMHVVLAALYGLTIWAALLAYCAILGRPLFWPVVLGPVVISGAVVVLSALDFAVSAFSRWLWRSLATVRLWRSAASGSAAKKED